MNGLLGDDVLVLNKNWAWIGMTTVEEAFKKLCGGGASGARAYVIDIDYQAHDLASWMRQPVEERFIQTPSQRVAVPDVIMMIQFGDMPRKAMRWSRMKVLKRDRYTCQYCGAQPGNSSLTIDHVLPQSRGGTSTWENTVACCGPCNGRKGDRKPSEAGLKLKKPPQAPHEDIASRIHEVKESWKPYVGSLAKNK